MGLPFSFASHFAPDMLGDAISIYRANFKPSAQLAEPYVSAGVMAIIGDSEDHAKQLFTSVQQQFANLRRNANKPMPPPVEDIRLELNEMEIRGINSTLRYALVGDKAATEEQLNRFVAAFGVDEVILSFPIFEQARVLKAIEAVGSMQVKAAVS